MSEYVPLWSNPYVGPRAFDQNQQDYFFGRDEEIAILEGLVLARPATLLYSQSGAGKSSLLRAGLAPSLTRSQKIGRGARERSLQKVHEVLVTTVGGALPLNINPGEMANVFVFSVLRSLRPTDEPENLLQQTLEDGLAPFVAPESGDTGRAREVVLIVDQLEELFTRHTDRWRDREVFFKQVSEVLKTHQSLRVLLSMREDYIAELNSLRWAVARSAIVSVSSRTATTRCGPGCGA